MRTDAKSLIRTRLNAHTKHTSNSKKALIIPVACAEDLAADVGTENMAE